MEDNTQMFRYRFFRKKATRYAALAFLSISFAGGLLGLVESADRSLPKAEMYISPSAEGYGLGSIFTVEVRLSVKEPINVAASTLTYPADELEIVKIDKSSSLLNFWIEDPEHGSHFGSIVFSGGIHGKKGFRGEGKLLTILFRSKQVGQASIHISDSDVLASDGAGTALAVSTHDALYAIDIKGRNEFDLNADGKVDMADVGRFVEHWEKPYDALYDVDHDGKVRFKDLAMLVLVLISGEKNV